MEANKKQSFQTVNEITKVKIVKPNQKNFWLLELLYGDAAYDKTAKFQIPQNVFLKSI